MACLIAMDRDSRPVPMDIYISHRDSFADFVCVQSSSGLLIVRQTSILLGVGAKCQSSKSHCSVSCKEAGSGGKRRRGQTH